MWLLEIDHTFRCKRHRVSLFITGMRSSIDSPTFNRFSISINLFTELMTSWTNSRWKTNTPDEQNFFISKLYNYNFRKLCYGPVSPNCCPRDQRYRDFQLIWIKSWCRVAQVWAIPTPFRGLLSHSPNGTDDNARQTKSYPPKPSVSPKRLWLCPLYTNYDISWETCLNYTACKTHSCCPINRGAKISWDCKMKLNDMWQTQNETNYVIMWNGKFDGMRKI